MRCPNCGWENPDNVSNCEKCNTPFKAGKTAPSSNSSLNKTVTDADLYEKTVLDNPQPKKPTKPTMDESINKTVNAWSFGAPAMIARCKLTPITMAGENPKYVPGEALFKGDYVELNRQNLDPDNMTITSKVQATLTHKDGGWYIEDKSSQQTTLIQVSSPTKIKDGDIILMGNRMFLFSEE